MQVNSHFHACYIQLVPVEEVQRCQYVHTFTVTGNQSQLRRCRGASMFVIFQSLVVSGGAKIPVTRPARETCFMSRFASHICNFNYRITPQYGTHSRQSIHSRSVYDRIAQHSGLRHSTVHPRVAYLLTTSCRGHARITQRSRTVRISQTYWQVIAFVRCQLHLVIMVGSGWLSFHCSGT